MGRLLCWGLITGVGLEKVIGIHGEEHIPVRSNQTFGEV